MNPFEKLQVGQHCVVKRTFSQGDFDRFAILSGDDNPIHVDPEFAAQTRFGKTVCHGMLLYSTIASVLGVTLPGPGTIQLEQTLMFPAPTYAGNEVEVRVQVMELRPEARQAILETNIIQADNQLSCEGQTLVGFGRNSLDRPVTDKAIADLPDSNSQSNELKGLKVGQQATIERTFTGHDLSEYVDLTGDLNPIYIDPTFATRQGFNGRPVPGGLLGGLFSYLLGTKLPGRGTNWLKQRLVFHRPAPINQAIRASVEIVRLRPEKQLVYLLTLCRDASSETICSGQALVLIRDLSTTTE